MTTAAPAGFWRRCAAWTLDAVVLAPVAALACAGTIAARAVACADAADALAALLAARMAQAFAGMASPALLLQQWLGDPALRDAVRALQAAAAALAWPPLLVFAALSLAWHLGFEASPRRATPGQRALGLRVEDANGAAPGIGRLLLRFGAGAASWATLNIGHALAAVPPLHRALHDRLSATRVVVVAGAGPLPGWAKAWLWLLAAALLLAQAWLAAAWWTTLDAALLRELGG